MGHEASGVKSSETEPASFQANRSAHSETLRDPAPLIEGSKVISIKYFVKLVDMVLGSLTKPLLTDNICIVFHTHHLCTTTLKLMKLK